MATIQRLKPASPDCARPVRHAEVAFDKAEYDGRLHALEVQQLEPAIERRKWDAAVLAMQAYYHPTNWNDEGGPIEHFPPAIMFVLARLVTVGLNGEDDPSFTAARHKLRRRSIGNQEALHDLVLYVRAAGGDRGFKEGRESSALKAALGDDDPVETVRLAYGFNTRRQVCSYLTEEEYRTTDPKSLILRYTNLDTKTQAELLRVKMKKSAEYWRKFKTKKQVVRRVRLLAP